VGKTGGKPENYKLLIYKNIYDWFSKYFRI